MNMLTRFTYDDGGRKAAGIPGKNRDCVCRAIAIATEKPYREVYDELERRSAEYAASHRSRVAKAMQAGKNGRGTDPTNGQYRIVYDAYLKDIGWTFTPTMSFGSGCKVHLQAAELPAGRIITRLSKHLAAVIDGEIRDTHDPSREGTRCVYGYWSKA
jgi:hypothetical protein